MAIEILLSILCIYTLSIWWYWLLRNSYENHLEGNGTVAIHLSSYCIYAITWQVDRNYNWNLEDISAPKFHNDNNIRPPSDIWSYYSAMVPHLCLHRLPLPPKIWQRYQPCTDQHTHPPSTRISLPSNTADYAPNFLSESTFMDSTYIFIFMWTIREVSRKQPPCWWLTDTSEWTLYPN